MEKNAKNMFNFNAEEEDYETNLFDNEGEDDSDEIDANRSV